MGKLNMTRRSFVKTAAVSAAVAAVVSAPAPPLLAENENAAATESAVTRIRSCCRGCGKVECGGNGCTCRTARLFAPGRRGLLPHYGQPLLQGPGVHSGGLPPRPHQVPHEAHEPQRGRRRSRRCAFPGTRGLSDHRRQHPGDHRGVRPIIHLHLVRHGRQWCMQSDLAMALLLFGTPNIVAAYQVCRAAPLRQPYRQHCQAWSWSELINHSTKFVQWATERSQSNYDDAARTGWTSPAAPTPSSRWTAPDEPGTYRQVLAAAAPL